MSTYKWRLIEDRIEGLPLVRVLAQVSNDLDKDIYSHGVMAGAELL